MFQKAQELVAKMRDLNAFLTTGIQKVVQGERCSQRGCVHVRARLLLWFLLLTLLRTAHARSQALDSRTRDVAVERKRIVAECNKLIDQQLAGLNEHLEKYIRKEQVWSRCHFFLLLDCVVEMLTRARSKLKLCGYYFLAWPSSQALQETERALREQISSAFDFCLTGEEVANLEVQLDKMHMALEQTVVSKKNIYQAIDDVMKHRARVGVN